MNSNRWMMLAIMAAVTVWGAFLAVGAYRYNHDPLRGGLVMACFLGFLAFWKVMLVSRDRRLARRQKPH